MPLHVYEGLSGRLITTMLQAKRFPGAQRLAVVKRLGKRLRQVWPHTRLIVRGDSHLAYPAVMQWIEAQPSSRARPKKGFWPSWSRKRHALDAQLPYQPNVSRHYANTGRDRQKSGSDWGQRIKTMDLSLLRLMDGLLIRTPWIATFSAP
jgi:Transposase DDE domain group 1